MGRQGAPRTQTAQKILAFLRLTASLVSELLLIFYASLATFVIHLSVLSALGRTDSASGSIMLVLFSFCLALAFWLWLFHRHDDEIGRASHRMSYHCSRARASTERQYREGSSSSTGGPSSAKGTILGRRVPKFKKAAKAHKKMARSGGTEEKERVLSAAAEQHDDLKETIIGLQVEVQYVEEEDTYSKRK